MESNFKMKLNCGQSTFVIFFCFQETLWLIFDLFFGPLCWARNAINAKCYKCWLRLCWFKMKKIHSKSHRSKWWKIEPRIRFKSQWQLIFLQPEQVPILVGLTIFFTTKKNLEIKGNCLNALTISDPRKYSILLNFALRKSRIWGRKEQRVWKVKEIWVFEEYEPLPFDIRCR